MLLVANVSMPSSRTNSLLFLSNDEVKAAPLISTVVRAEVVCAPKFLPISIFLSHTLRSKITVSNDLRAQSQYQNSLQTGHGRGRDLVTTSIFSLPRVVRSINVQCSPHPLRHHALIYGPDQPIRQ